METTNKAGFSRRHFLKQSAVAAGALAFINVDGPAFALGQALAQQTNSDLELANFEYGLEALAITAYKTAAGTNLLAKPVLDIALKFVAQHSEHQAGWEAEIKRMGGKPQALVIGKYPDLKTQADILAFAKTLEEVAVCSYYVAINKFQDDSRVNIAASIMPIEAQHVAVFAAALQQDPLPTPFVTGTSEADIGKIATALQIGPAGGTGGALPTAPASGAGGASKQGDYSGIIAATLAAVGAAAGAIALRRRNTGQSEEQ